MWKRIEPSLLTITPLPLSKYEQAFGLYPRTKAELNATILRNWITFSFRSLTMREERKAFYTNLLTLTNEDRFTRNFNRAMQKELSEKHWQYRFRNIENNFDSIVSVNNFIVKDENEEYKWPDIK